MHTAELWCSLKGVACRLTPHRKEEEDEEEKNQKLLPRGIEWVVQLRGIVRAVQLRGIEHPAAPSRHQGPHRQEEV